MTDVAPPPFPLLEIVSFVDETTVILVGSRVDELRDGDALYILGIGRSVVPKANIPLISPKASLVVTFPAGPYALARTPETTTRAFSTLEALAAGLDFQRATTVTRRKLTTDERIFLGDPGKEPVRVGDPVIRKADLGAFIRYRAETTQN